MKQRNLISNYLSGLVITLSLVSNQVFCVRKYNRQDVLKLREEVRDMFQHAYDSYLKYASNYDELRPLSCDGVDTWGSYSLTLIDSLDTLAVMGNFSEFRRVVDILVEKSNFDSDINVSVFETNIRIVGGLLSAHLMQHRSGAKLEPGWPCNGPLLRLAEDVAKRLLTAFDTSTGMPYGTINLRYGVPDNETSVTCTAGIGTFIVEFGALSRLTGDPIYEEVALNAIHQLHKHKSSIGLYGNHIDVQTGRWTGVDSGIGAGIDSYYEYLVKGSIMLNRPELMRIFNEGKLAIDKYLKKNDWHVWASMTKGQVTIPVFQSLDAYWPGVLSMLGDIPNAMKSIYNYHSVWKQYGFLPEFYNIPNTEAGTNRESYPLRPELIESVMYLYRATGDSYLLEVGEDILRSIQNSAKTSCGYATIKNVRDHRKENRMESFFLAETTKYLYLLFDPDHFLNNNGGVGTIINTPNGECIIDAGGYIFNTEAHPIDSSALRCCYENSRHEKIFSSFDDFNTFKKKRTEPKRTKSEKSSLIDPKILSQNLDNNKNEWLEFFNLINSTFHNEIKKMNLENEKNSTKEKMQNGSEVTSTNIVNNTNEENEIKIKSTERSLNVSKEKEQLNRSEFIEPIKSFAEYPEKSIPEEKKPFDEQQMIERLRKLNNINEEESEKDYELLTCKAQSFSQRLAVLGEILT